MRGPKRGVVGYSRKSALLEEAITQMNGGKYGRSSTALKELLALDPQNMEARRLFATLHLRLGSLIPARQAFDSLISEAFQRQDFWLAESLLREYLAAGPRCVPFIEKLGALYQEKGDALEAVDEYGKAIDILIEDPDPDNPTHASQLYAKIRELAPASPVAFRLASFFDAQTGELLAREPIKSEPSNVAASLDIPEGGESIQTGPQLMEGGMPWEIQDAQPTTSDTRHEGDASDSFELVIPPKITDCPATQGRPFEEELVPSDPSVQEQTASREDEVRGAADKEIHTLECEPAPSGAQIEGLSGQRVPDGSNPFIVAVDLIAERSEAQADLGSTVSIESPVMAQEQDRELVKVEPEPPYDVSGPSVSVLREPIEETSAPTAPEPPISSTRPIEDTIIMPSLHVEEISASSLRMDASTDGPMEDQESQPSLRPSVETESKEVVPEQASGIGAPSGPGSVSTDEILKPWKQPSFSWESVFNSGWKSESDHSAHIPPSELTPTVAEETPPPAPETVSLQEPMSENQAVEIPKREESVSLGSQTSSESPIAPMPWDHVQESVIAISPGPTHPPMTENLTQAMAQSPDPSELDVTPTVSESQDQFPPQIQPSSDISPEETDSFSIAQTPQASVSPEPVISIADFGQGSLPTESISAPAESELQFRMASAPTMEELQRQQAATQPIVSLVLAHGLVADEVLSSTECPLQSAESILVSDDHPGITAAPRPLQESIAQPSFVLSSPTRERLSGELHEIPVPDPLLNPQRTWEPSSEIAASPDPAQETVEVQAYERHPRETTSLEARAPIPEPVPEQEEWVKAGESIRFVEQPQASPATHAPPPVSARQDAGRSMSVVAAVDVLFESARNVRTTETREPVAESKPSRKSSSPLSRVRVAIAGFVISCFSTTRAIMVTCAGLVMFSGILIALGIGAIGLTWKIMEEAPSPAFHNLMTTPQRTLSDYKKNGYLLFLGIDAPADQDPVEAGFGRKPDTNHGRLSSACVGGSESKTIEGSNASANVMRGWVRSADPVGEFTSHQEAIQGWGHQHQLTLNRYGQWQKIPFEDWGYGQTVGPPCAAMIFAHQLYVAVGFLQGVDLGVGRLETDMEAWRIVLSQARTLNVKMVALQAINDNIAVASGLLVRSDFDGRYLGRITKALRPLDQGERSMRWPMQSELVSASKTYESQLKAAKAEDQPVYTLVASALPLPKQRRLNDYAEYYDASYKAAGEGQHGSLPKWKDYIRFPASGLMDYLTNPIENIVGLEPLAPWDVYNEFVIDTDAHLRLASLQAWLRRGAADGDLVTRIAKAGQNFYDPYTGMPMLMNRKKGVLYSVGHDGKDQDADAQSDVVVKIPVGQPSAVSADPTDASSQFR
jgi:hypothetical protein